MAKLGTSDLHFGHSNILIFTDRYRHMLEAGFLIDSRHLQRLKDRCATPEDKEVVVMIHDDWLIGHLNSQISNDDIVYHTGDFSFYKDVGSLRRIINQLAGSWIFTIGNHDNESKLREACKGTRHKVVGHYHETHINKKAVIMFHYPIQDWNKVHHGSYMLHGHLHGTDGHGDHKVGKLPRRHDIGMDAHPECKLFNLEELVV